MSATSSRPFPADASTTRARHAHAVSGARRRASPARERPGSPSALASPPPPLLLPPPPSSSASSSRRRAALCSPSLSVVARPTPSRSKRYARAHAAHLPQNEFPVFSLSGDVDIRVAVGGVEDRYLLHRDTLARCSGFFEASTSSEWSRTQQQPQQQQQQQQQQQHQPPLLVGGNELARIPDDASADPRPRRRWAYELHPGAGPGDIPMLVQRGAESDAGTGPSTNSSSSAAKPALPPSSIFASPKSESRSGHHALAPPSARVSFSRSVTHLAVAPVLASADDDLLRDYSNLFRIFYNYPPLLDGVNVADAYVQCKSLLALADQYDALDVVGPRVDHHLLQFQSRLWTQIAKYPVSYLRLGFLARSKVMFQEALIHVVGQWPVGERSLRAALPDLVLDIIEDKVDELDEKVARVEGRLFRLSLTTPRGDRVTPSNSYLDWLVVSLFRHWLTDKTTPPSPHAVHCAGRVYRTLGSASPAAFLAHDDCKRFLKLTPDLYSRDNLRRFEKRMDELKAMARDVVRPLLGSRLELDSADSSAASHDIAYLTCTTVANRDLPWPVDA